MRLNHYYINHILHITIHINEPKLELDYTIAKRENLTAIEKGNVIISCIDTELPALIDKLRKQISKMKGESTTPHSLKMEKLQKLGFR